MAAIIIAEPQHEPMGLGKRKGRETGAGLGAWDSGSLQKSILI